MKVMYQPVPSTSMQFYGMIPLPSQIANNFQDKYANCGGRRGIRIRGLGPVFGFRLLNRVRGLGEGLNRRTIPQFQRMNRIKPQTNAHPNGPICHLKQNLPHLKGESRDGEW